MLRFCFSVSLIALSILGICSGLANKTQQLYCFDPVIPAAFINVRFFEKNVLSLVLKAKTCYNKSHPDIYFESMKCQFGGHFIEDIPVFAGYNFVGHALPGCTVNLMMSNSYHAPDSDYLFNDEEIRMWANGAMSNITDWNCDLFPREKYETVFTSKINELVVPFDQDKDQTVPFLLSPSDNLQKQKSASFGIEIIVVICLVFGFVVFVYAVGK